MASLQQRPSGKFRIVFMYGGSRFFASLKTFKRQEADEDRIRLESNLRDLERGRTVLPAGADLVQFLLTDGKVKSKPVFEKSLSLGELFDHYEKHFPSGAKEENTRRMERIHQRHLLKHFGSTCSIDRLTRQAMQEYIQARSMGKGRHGQPMSHITIKKELSTLATVWNRYALSAGLVKSELSIKGFIFSKRRPKPRFQTRQQIERQIHRGGLNAHEIETLWECLFLTLPEIQELLSFVEARTTNAEFLMFCLAAQTGARRSEMLRIHIDDIDFELGRITLREKKRDRSHELTFRSVPLAPFLAAQLHDWVAKHPGGQHLICDELGRQLSLGQAARAFRSAVDGSKWEVLLGWHVLRHSFASNCAAKGIDQRIIDEWMGHQTDEMRRRYRHLIPNDERLAIQSVFGLDTARSS